MMKVSLICFAVGLWAVSVTGLDNAEPVDLQSLRQLLHERRAAHVGPSNPHARPAPLPADDEEQTLEEWQNDEGGRSLEDEEDFPHQQPFDNSFDEEARPPKQRRIPQPYDDDSYEEQFPGEQRYFEEPEEQEFKAQQLDESEELEPEFRSAEDESFPEEIEEQKQRPFIAKGQPVLEQRAFNSFVEREEKSSEEVKKPKDKSNKPERGKSLDALSKQKVVLAQRYDAEIKLGGLWRNVKLSGVIVTVEPGKRKFFLRRRLVPRIGGRRWWTTSIRSPKNMGDAWKLVDTKTVTKAKFGDYLNVIRRSKNSVQAATRMMQLD